MATPKYSLMDRFDSDTESIESYLERVAIYFRAIRVEERNQVDVFLSLLSSKMYSLSTDSLIYNKVTGRGSTSGATQGEHESRAT